MSLSVVNHASWSSPELTGLNRLPMHAVRRQECIVLDGAWRFQLLPRPDAEPTSAWRSIDVPGCWTMQGTTDRPHYTNVVMPFPELPPIPPANNPTGLYERTIEVPAEWSDRRVVLHIGAAESVLIVRVNDQDVGISKDSHLAAEFDVTNVIRPAQTNRIVLRVVKWSDASFIEDQDQWWHGGITRSVFLYATGPVYLADVHARAGLAEDLATGLLDLQVDVGYAGVPPERGWLVEARLEGLDQTLRASTPAGETPQRGQTPRPDGRVKLHAELPGVHVWSAEQPRLYQLRVELQSPSGEVVDETSLRVGFRRVEVDGLRLLINAQPVLLRGVNRHDFDQHTGRVVPADGMRQDIVLMKQFGFNALRTSHYPNDPVLLDLCDELGMYVIDEADIESHAFISSLCDDARYLNAWVDRVSRMARRDKNHPCIILWSLGNESGYGLNHNAAAGWLRRFDPSRPLHYEGAIRGSWESDQTVSDITCPMYPPISALVEHVASGKQRHPLIMCEYSHAMGNSNGCLAEYWDAIESTDGLQGGFIWEFWNHGLVQLLPDGSTRWAYGGDFGDVPNDGNFCLDGLVWPDRTPTPALWEHKYLATPVRVAAEPDDLRRGRIQLHNRQSFTGVDWLRARFEVSVRGEVVFSSDLPMPRIRPAETVSVDLPGWSPETWPVGGERWLTVRFFTARTEAWAPAGFEVGWAQLELEAPPVRASTPRNEPPMVLVDSDGSLSHPLLSASPRLCLWRAPTDNDRIGGAAERWRAWGVFDLERRLMGVEREGTSIVVRSQCRTASGIAIPHEQRFRGLPDGGVQVEEFVDIPDTLFDLARVGTVLELVPELEHIEWFGRGPHDSYPDRRRGARVSRWRSTVHEQYVPYIRPQEHGGHADVRWIQLSDGASQGLRLEFTEPRQVSVSHFRAADLAAATHDVELTPRPEIIVHLDAAHRGLGTASCGPDTLPEYLIPPGPRRWTWWLMSL